MFQVKIPEWADIVKTSVAKELAPYDEDWYYTRCASVARHIYVRSPVGVKTITKIYGGKRLFSPPLHYYASASPANARFQAMSLAKIYEAIANPIVDSNSVRAFKFLSVFHPTNNFI